MIIQLNYLYRDASNYKNYGSVTISCREFDLREIDFRIRQRLIDGEYFSAGKAGIPELFFDVSNEDDHDWHEYQ